MSARTPQTGITALGVLILVSVCGLLGLAALKITPLYIQNMRIGTILDDLQEELDGTGTTPAAIRTSLNRRLSIEGISIPLEDVRITQARSGYQVRIQYDNRASFIADIWFLVVFDEQIEIRR